MKLTLVNKEGLDFSGYNQLNKNVIEFGLKVPEYLKEETFENFEKTFNDEQKNLKKILLQISKKSGFSSEEEALNLMKINFNHVFDSITYLTNGREIISILKKDDSFQIGKHYFQGIFGNFFMGNANVLLYTLKSFSMQSASTLIQARRIACSILSVLDYKVIPANKNGKETEILYKNINGIHYFKYGFDEIEKQSSYNGKPVDFILREVFDWVKPDIVKCCLNCKSYTCSSMSQSMSNGSSGYCKYSCNDNKNLSHTSIFDWCNNFEIKKNTM